MKPRCKITSYVYDGLYRLTAARYPTGGAADKAGTLTYGYTLNGNRTSFGHQFGAEGWSYYPGTNLASNGGGDVQGGRLYGFDYLGNRTREREYGTAAQAAAQGNDWTRSRVAGFNADGGLVRYAVYDKNNDNSLDTSLYAYGRDALGKKNFGAHGRIASTGDTSWTISRRYTWDGDWVVADSTEVGRRYYAYLGHRRVAEVAEDISGKWTSRAVLTDHLGTVTGIVGDSGNVEAAYLLDPYGNLEHYAGKYQTLYLMTGKEYVSELAGYEFGARVYDPVMGMWWGRDKAAQFWSPYASTGWGLNQMNGVDPDGYSVESALKLICENRLLIKESASKWNVPAKAIASVIFQEKLKGNWADLKNIVAMPKIAFSNTYSMGLTEMQLATAERLLKLRGEDGTTRQAISWLETKSGSIDLTAQYLFELKSVLFTSDAQSLAQAYNLGAEGFMEGKWSDVGERSTLFQIEIDAALNGMILPTNTEEPK